jgi:hypothetical protein
MASSRNNWVRTMAVYIHRLAACVNDAGPPGLPYFRICTFVT